MQTMNQSLCRPVPAQADHARGGARRSSTSPTSCKTMIARRGGGPPGGSRPGARRPTPRRAREGATPMAKFQLGRHARAPARRKTGVDGGRERGRPSTARLRADSMTSPSRVKKQARRAQHHVSARGVTTKDLVDLHPAVRDDDRRRPAARAVPRHPRDPDRRTRTSAKVLVDVKAHVERRLDASPTRSRKHPKVFDELYVNLVAAGEVGGILDTILQPPRDLHREGDEAASARSRARWSTRSSILVRRRSASSPCC